MEIYLLKLTEKKYYVGRTRDSRRRWEEHRAGEGSSWTKIYEPVSMTILKKDGDIFDEDKYVKIMMQKYGIDNVRGGSYSGFHLSFYQKSQLYNEIKNATDRCFNCGKEGHFVADCKFAKVTIATNPQVISKPLTTRSCSICKKPGHNKTTCPRNK